MKIYGDLMSGNCYKLKLLCDLLQLEHEWIHVDILREETRTPAFLRLNPNAKVPLLELDDGRTLSESNAILNYLASGSALLPQDRFSLAKVLQWQFFEQYSHEPYIAVARFIGRYLGLPEERRAEYHAKQPGGHRALRVMEQQLQDNDYLVDNRFSVADISLYAYTHVAPEGGFDLSDYPAIRAWLARIEATRGYQPMPTN
ncbi:glutathione S-transferase [Halopseudomonas sabulinigri]|uniref:Glutathione S-transferase n=1 Tax=Halopseudomonas sabulinigri TaxID=472181 RepID=A0A1H1WFR5_9GAMM|nr:glutathione S-transferase family protein [Halopseudomonas sabulinigri]SDS95471.1 glutathione S-transferase [Halopseudomonas sabulinigri]